MSESMGSLGRVPEQFGGSGADDRITVVSTHAVDVIPRADGTFDEVPGGPAHYVCLALARLGWSYRLVTGSVARSQVVPGAGGEEYILSAIERIHLPRHLPGRAVIMSPIIQEIDAHCLPSVEGMLAVDLQGFVRVPGTRSGAVHQTFDLSGLLSRADVVKASEKELALLTPRSSRAVERGVLVITRGTRGAIVCSKGEKVEVPARAVHVKSTIGAGDMYLAAYVCALLAGSSPVGAAERAARFVEEMLTERAAAEAT